MTSRAHYWTVTTLMLAAALMALSAGPSTADRRSAAVVGPAISVGGVSVSGLTASEVEEALTPLANRYASYPVTVAVAGQSVTTTFGELGGRIDYDRAAREALAQSNRPRGVFDRVRGFFRGPDAIAIPLPLVFRNPPMPDPLQELNELLGGPTKDATIRRNGKEMIITPGEPGRGLSLRQIRLAARDLLKDPTRQEAVATARSRDLEAWLLDVAPLRVTARIVEVQPRITEADLMSITTRLSIFSTSLRSSSRNRTHNIAKTARAIEYTVLLPGDVFSYNETVGPRTAKLGYKLASVIVGGKLVPGIGGGICQTSGTLYNAALLADLKMVRRYRHGFPVAYLPSGRDATVVYGSRDFSFQNSLPHPIMVEVRVYRRRLYASIWGTAEDFRDVELIRSGISATGGGSRVIHDPKLPAGKKVVVTKARTGWRVTLTRVVKEGDQVVRREVISRDYYPPRAGVVRVGSGPAVGSDPTASGDGDKKPISTTPTNGSGDPDGGAGGPTN